MKRIIIFGNSGAGKSTLAKKYESKYSINHLDLDILAWEDTDPPKRSPLSKSMLEIDSFTSSNNEWVIEGGYTDLLQLIVPIASEMFFLNPGDNTCIENCRKRPWEPHKYESYKKQNDNLDMLIDWIKGYAIRDDEFSLLAHRKLFEKFSGKKKELNETMMFVS